MFQHTAARRRLGNQTRLHRRRRRFNTQPPEGGWAELTTPQRPMAVSTHSRPKAAGTVLLMQLQQLLAFQHTAARRRLENLMYDGYVEAGFQHTAARRRLGEQFVQQLRIDIVSTHSRPKAAGRAWLFIRRHAIRFQHTAARRRLEDWLEDYLIPNIVSTHSRPKAAGVICFWFFVNLEFQHTAARRRLGEWTTILDKQYQVSTHSRPKAAGCS